MLMSSASAGPSARPAAEAGAAAAALGLAGDNFWETKLCLRGGVAAPLGNYEPRSLGAALPALSADVIKVRC